MDNQRRKMYAKKYPVFTFKYLSLIDGEARMDERDLQIELIIKQLRRPDKYII